MSGCPSRQDLERLLAQPWIAEQHEPISAHVEGCTLCQAVLEDLTKDNSPATLSVNRTVAVDQPARALLNALKQAGPLEPAEPGLRVRLEVTAGPHLGRSFAFFEHDTLLIGRSSRAHVQLPDEDEYFSRLHLLIEVNPPFCRITDLGSKNGTLVNGSRVAAANLRHGDQISAGQTVMQVSIEARQASTLSPAGSIAADPSQAALPAAPVAGTAPAIAGYELLDELGRGGMGVVYLARRKVDGLLVALKTLVPAAAGSQAQVDRFLREAGILRALDHPRIVRFREAGQSGELLYFVMDYVPGSDAARLLQEHGPLPVGRAAELVCQILEALEYAHARGFVHRDIKPPNILIAAPAGPSQSNRTGRSASLRGTLVPAAVPGGFVPRDTVWLADFGLARTYQASRLSGLTMAGDIGGTIAFMAPEQITHFREASPKVDQYAAGATLYNLLTDRHPHDLPSRTQQQLLMILEQDPVPIRERRPDIPARLAETIHRSLSRDPAARFETTRDMRQALETFCTADR